MRTNESVVKELKSTRRKLFYKMYMVPWLILTLALIIFCGFLLIKNNQLENKNMELTSKVMIPEKILVRLYDPEALEILQNKEEDFLAFLQHMESHIEKHENFQNEVIIDSGESLQKRGYNFEEENNSKVEKVEEVKEVEEVAIDKSKVEKTKIDEETLALHMLKRELDNENLGMRSSEEIRQDFSVVRTFGFTRENYIYAQELGVRVEVQVIKALEDILEKKIDEYNEIFISEKNKNLFLRDIQYEVSEGVLNQFRIYWQLNK